MLLSLENKQHIEIFVGLFQLLKNWGSSINLQFRKEQLFIQVMDKSHVCLSLININKEWFSKYEINDKITQTNACVDVNVFSLIISQALKYSKLEINMDDVEPEKVFINISNNKDEFTHFYELLVIDSEQELLEIPSVEYDAEFSIDSKKISELFNELIQFGENLSIVCNEEAIELGASGDNGKLKIKIPPDNLTEYAISEGEIIDIEFSLTHIVKKCLSSKLSSSVTFSISKDIPMAVKYDLGDENYAIFYIAPKISD
jgi:proliferating cell nuclear antigen